jgi:hypothetical protein
MEDYLVISADLSDLTEAEADAFVDAAAELGLDVDDLPPHMGVALEITVVASTTLAAVCAKLIAMAGDGAALKLWELIRPLFHRKPGPLAIEDRQQRVTFVWDEHARQDGPLATAALITIGQAVAAIPDGTVLTWDPKARQWRYASPS